MTLLPLHWRIHLLADGTVATTRFARCPEASEWTSVERCLRCAHCGSSDDASVRCDVAGAGLREGEARRAPITDVMDAKVLCVDFDATVERACATMDEHEASLSIVVDEARHAIGVCSRSDLDARAPGSPLGLCMTPFVIAMLDNTTVADALALVVERDLRHIPVLSGGHVIGIVTPRAVLRWLRRGDPPSGEKI